MSTDDSIGRPPLTIEERKRRQQIERQRQYRERQVRGVMIARAPVDPVVYNELVRHGMLPSEFESRSEIVGEALVNFIRKVCHLSTST